VFGLLGFLTQLIFPLDAPLGLEVVPHDAVVEFTSPALPHKCTITCATCIACGKTCAHDGFGTPCDHCSNGNQACSFKRSPVDFHRTLEFLCPLVNLGGGGTLFLLILAYSVANMFPSPRLGGPFCGSSPP
jgi:hypothetical protein